MAGVSPVLYSPTQQAYPTPSPITNTSGSWSSSHPTFLLYSNLVLRFFSFLFSAVSAISLAAPLFHSTYSNKRPFFGDYDGLRYCFGVAILTSLYSFSLLFKGLHDIAFKGILISDTLCDSITFVFDQLLGYLLMSSSSAAVPAIKQMGSNDGRKGLKKVAIAATTMSFATFLAIAACALISGYKICKRMIW